MQATTATESTGPEVIVGAVGRSRAVPARFDAVPDAPFVDLGAAHTVRSARLITLLSFHGWEELP